MNRQQKRKSRMIKAYIAWVYEVHGTTISYKEARRQIRNFHRLVRKVPTAAKAIIKGIKRFRYYHSVKRVALCDTLKPLCGTGTDGLRADAVFVDEFAPALYGDSNWVIDETPIEEPTEMWPKENPNLNYTKEGRNE